VIQAVQIAARQQVVRDLQVAEEIPLVYLPAPAQIASSMLDFRFTEQLAADAYADASSMLSALSLHSGALPPGLYGMPPLRADHPEVAAALVDLRRIALHRLRTVRPSVHRVAPKRPGGPP
jgi:hypothetical protein